MEEPQMSLGVDEAWLDLRQTGSDTWRLSANWCSQLTADFPGYLSDAEVADLAGQMLCSRAWTRRQARASRPW